MGAFGALARCNCIFEPIRAAHKPVGFLYRTARFSHYLTMAALISRSFSVSRHFAAFHGILGMDLLQDYAGMSHSPMLFIDLLFH